MVLPLEPYFIPFSFMPFLVSYVLVYNWARKSVKDRRRPPRFLFFSAILILCVTLILRVVAVTYGYLYALQFLRYGLMSVYLRMLVEIILYSCLLFFPLYTLLKGRLIPYRVFALSVTLLVVLGIITLKYL